MHTYTIHIIYPIFTYSILCTAPPNTLLLYTPSINSHTHIHYSYTHSLTHSYTPPYTRPLMLGVNVTSAYPVTWMKKHWSPAEDRLARDVDGKSTVDVV